MIPPWVLMVLAINLAGVGEGAEEAALPGSAIDPKESEAEGMAALRESDGHPDRSITAALAFAKALAYYRDHGDTDKVCELQADIYWCKKRMDLDSLQRYVAAKSDETKALADTMVSVADAAVPIDQASAFMSRAQQYAQAHPDKHLEIAIRYFEIADRFVGTPTSLQAQRLSLAEQRQAAAGTDVVGAQLQAQVTVPGDLPAAASKVLGDLNTAASAITTKASQALQREQATLVDTLTKEADAAQRRGSLDAVVAVQHQLAALDSTQPGLSGAASAAVATYRAVTKKLMERVQADLATERVKAARKLDPLQADETKRGNVAGALAIKEQISHLQVGAGVAAHNLDVATMRKRFATHQVGWKDGTLSLGYDFSDPTQMQDFDVSTAKLKFGRALGVAVGDSITHKVSWKSVTVTCQIGMTNRGGTHLRLGGGVIVQAHNYNAWIADLFIGSQKLGEATFDPAYTSSGDPNQFVPIELTATGSKTSVTFAKAVIGKPQGTSPAGQVILCSGDGGDQFRNLVLEGVPTDEWLQAP